MISDRYSGLDGSGGPRRRLVTDFVYGPQVKRECQNNFEKAVKKERNRTFLLDNVNEGRMATSRGWMGERHRLPSPDVRKTMLSAG